MKYRIVKWINGHFGYKKYFELQCYNTIYKDWYCIKNALELYFIENECIIKEIDFKSLEIIEISQEG